MPVNASVSLRPPVPPRAGTGTGDTGVVISIDVVLETDDAVGFSAWPIAPPSSDRLLVLSHRMSPAEVGTAIAVVFSYNHFSTDLITDRTGARLEQYLTEAGGLIAPGGLRFRDTVTHAEVGPGCCFGLENWRDWQALLCGEQPWLGHAPTPRFHLDGKVIRLHQDDRASIAPPAVEFETGDLPGLLASAQRRLRGFLDRVEHWILTTAPHLTGPLTAALDTHLRINEPLRGS